MRGDGEFIHLGSHTEDYPRNREKLVNSRWYYDTYNIPTNTVHKMFIPWFQGTNNETAYLMHLIVNNPIIQGLIVTKCDILRGKRLTLFNTQEKDKDGNPVPLDLGDFPPEIEDFYEFNQLNEKAYDAFYQHEALGNAFVEAIFAVGSSQSKKKVTELTLITGECVRAVQKRDTRQRIQAYGVSETWTSQMVQKNVEQIPAWYHKDFYNADRQFDRNTSLKNVMIHIKRNMPHFPFYTVPRFYGARHSMESQNLVPIFHKDNLENLFGLRMRVSISRELLERKMEEGDGKGNKYSEKQVLDMFAGDATKFFTGPENAGKAVATVHNYDQQGKPVHDMLFEKISSDLKDDAYTKLDPMLNQAVTSSLGTSPSLAGIILKSNLPSGSEQRYAWNIEVVKGTAVRDLVLQPVRFAHKFNNWPKHLVWGFEDAVMVTADEKKDGVKNNSNPTTEEDDVI